MFADTDMAFGSMGSFFDFDDDMGSFECNPPYDQRSIEQALGHIVHVSCQALRAARSPELFLLLLCGTKPHVVFVTDF